MGNRCVLVLFLAMLLVVGCGSQTAEPTSTVETDGAAEVATVVSSEAATPVAVQTLTATVAVSSTGGVDVALAAIEPVTGVLATVNDEEITWVEYEPELTQLLYSVTLQYGMDWNQAEYVAVLGAFQDQVLSTLISRLLLRQGALAEGIEATEEAIAARIEEEKASVLSSGQFASWEAFLENYGLSEAYYARLVEDDILVELLTEAHAPSREAEQVHARHILVADEVTANEVLTRLEEGEEWATLASELSLDTSNNESEGDLGWFPRGVMVTEFEEAAFSLEPGTTSDPIATQYGYHIIQVLEKGTRDVDDDTYDTLLSQAFDAWYEEQEAVADIEVAVTFGAEVEE